MGKKALDDGENAIPSPTLGIRIEFADRYTQRGLNAARAIRNVYFSLKHGVTLSEFLFCRACAQVQDLK